MKLKTTDFRAMKQRGEKIAVLTAYDFFTTKMLDEAGLPMLLVGDSLGMVVLGYETTLSVTMEEMLHHIRAVARAKPRGLIVGDLPYRTYETPEQAVANARRFMEAGADAVKLEGGEAMLAQVKAVLGAGIPVMGHIGLLPQSIEKLGGYKMQGRTTESAAQLLRDAECLDQAGVFAMVLECVVPQVAGKVTRAVAAPTIGIGSGPDCDGQVLVLHDMLGLTVRAPKHVKQFAALGVEMRRAFAVYRQEVEQGLFPSGGEVDH